MGRDYYPSDRHTSLVRPDHILSLMGEAIQLLPLSGRPVRPKAEVTVHRALEDTLLVYHRKTRLPYKILDAGPSPPHAVSKTQGIKQRPHQSLKGARAHGHYFIPVRSDGSLRCRAPRFAHPGWKKSLSRNEE